MGTPSVTEPATSTHYGGLMAGVALGILLGRWLLYRRAVRRLCRDLRRWERDPSGTHTDGYEAP
jgi:hypothetical protein